MATIADLRQAFAHPNVRAFYMVVRNGESSLTDEAYVMINGGGRITDFSRHPYEGLLTTQGGRAAGAPQFIPTTWGEIQRQYGLPDFSPESQDLGYVACLIKRNALSAVMAGEFDTAVELCRKEWTSLPGADENHASWTMERARKLYQEYGGTFGSVTQPAAPIEERTVNPEQENPLAPIAFLIPLLTSLADVFSPLLKAKLTQTLDKQVKDPAMSQQMAQQLMDIVKQAAAGAMPPVPAPQPPIGPGYPPVTTPSLPVDPATIDPVVAVGAVKSNPVLAAQVEADFAEYFDKMTPVFDRLDKLDHAAWAASEDSMDRAAQRAKTDLFDPGPTLLYAAVGGVALVTLFVGGTIAIQLWQNKPVGTEVWAALTGLIGWLTAKAGTIYDYRYGSSRQSAAKDVVIEEMSRRRQS